jgi:CubicO group peptidase (beta-lactamase class C family)
MVIRFPAVALTSLALLSTAGADELDRAIEDEMARQQVPGLSLAVVHKGEITRLQAYGFGDLEWRAKATPDTRFEIASMSKMFTGAAARILMDEGKLDPEAPLTSYFDGLPDSWRSMRVRHLVNMSSGLPEDWGGDLIPYDRDVVTAYDDASMVKAFTSLKMEAPPGTAFHYSSPGYAMLGMLVSRISGKPLPEFLAERVFKPASMDQSTFIDNWEIVPERAQGYRRAEGKVKKGWYLGQYLHARPDVGILSTGRDMAKWVIAVRAGRVVKNPDRLWQGATAESGHALDYSYGWFTGTLLGHRAVGHGGRYRTGFRSTVNVYPDDDLAVVVLANCDYANVDRLALLAMREFLPDLPDPEAESAKHDAHPARTASVIAALKTIAAGRIDEKTMNPDALDPIPISEASGFLKEVESFGYAGARRLPGQGLLVHGHRLVDYVSIKLQMKSGSRFFTVYRDDQGRMAYVELTE